MAESSDNKAQATVLQITEVRYLIKLESLDTVTYNRGLSLFKKKWTYKHGIQFLLLPTVWY